jgi:hypothetical protein
VVGENGAVLTSPDGIAWASQSSGAGGRLTAAAYALGQFVAVGDFGIVMASPDGTNWTFGTANVSETLWGIAYGNDQFVAVGDAGVILTSPDGFGWTSQSSGTLEQIYGVIFADNQFVAVVQDGTVLTSSEGVNWSRLGLGTLFEPSLLEDRKPHAPGALSFPAPRVNPALSAIAYGNNEFVGVGNNGTVLTSPDALTWTLRGAGALNNLWGIAFGGNEFVGAGWSLADTGVDQGRIFTSPDGVVWSASAVRMDARFNNIIYGAGGFVAVGDNGAILQSGGNLLAARPTLGAPRLLAGGAVELTLNGLPGPTYSIQVSTNLQVWSTIGALSFSNSPALFLDPGAAGLATRFYRTVSP